MDKELQDAILRSIQTEGASSEENKTISVIIASRTSAGQVLTQSSGLPRIKPQLVSQFNLILSQPETIKALSPLSIRCVLCRRVISYPAWYYQIRFAVKWFHYFICFDSNSPNTVTAKCYKRHID